MTEEVINENENLEEGEVVELEEAQPDPEEAVDDSELEQVEEPEQVANASEEDELAGYSDKVQKRINSLTRRLREAERASESAYNLANTLKQENQSLKETATKSNESLYSEAETRLQSQRTQAQAALKQAMMDQDYDKVAKAQDILARLAVEESKVKDGKISLEQTKNEQPVSLQEAQPVVQNAPPEPDPKAQSWAEKNQWFGEDKVLTMAAFGIHEELVDEGFDPSSDEYYTEVDNRLKAEFILRLIIDLKLSFRTSLDKNKKLCRSLSKKLLRQPEIPRRQEVNVKLNSHRQRFKWLRSSTYP
jgi:hypothetical protein